MSMGSERVKEFRRQRKFMAVGYKGGKCQKCGYCRCVQALEFHHRDPSEKAESNAPRAIDFLLTWDKLTAELDKCDMLCANCHREVEYQSTAISSGRISPS